MNARDMFPEDHPGWGGVHDYAQGMGPDELGAALDYQADLDLRIRMHDDALYHRSGRPAYQNMPGSYDDPHGGRHATPEVLAAARARRAERENAERRERERNARCPAPVRGQRVPAPAAVPRARVRQGEALMWSHWLPVLLTVVGLPVIVLIGVLLGS
ncbi:hypothetical protein ACIPWE_08500 [Streptomyces sp. NPDC090073]|uniref:hypothetical protein n=1 Tax=Streptomyces sp. NPDC090073 TaxID=3365936 RepID=UPI00380BDF4D